MWRCRVLCFFFFFNDTATTEIYTLSLHDALPICAYTQAQKFGADVLISRSATRLTCDRRPYSIEIDGGERLMTRTVVMATGAQYRKPNITNLMRFEGIGVYYGATFIEAQICGPDEAIVVGGGNSAGQAAVFLAQT